MVSAAAAVHAANGGGVYAAPRRLTVDEDEMRYQRICGAMGPHGQAPANNTIRLNSNQRREATRLVQSELGAMKNLEFSSSESGKSHPIDMTSRKQRLEIFLKTKFHADDAHFMVYQKIRIEVGDVRQNLLARGFRFVDGTVMRLADAITNVIHVVWDNTVGRVMPSVAQVHEVPEPSSQPSSFIPPRTLSTVQPTEDPHLRAVRFAQGTGGDDDVDDGKRASGRTGTVVLRSLSLMVPDDSSSAASSPATTPRAPLPSSQTAAARPPSSDGARSAQPGAPSSRRPLSRHQSMSALSLQNGRVRVGRHVRQSSDAAADAEVGAAVLSRCARIRRATERSYCFRAARWTWYLVPARARNYIVEDFIANPLREAIRDGARIGVLYVGYKIVTSVAARFFG